jgi:hypothetical protein
MAAERTVDAYVAALPDGKPEVAEAARRLVRSAAPEAREEFKWARISVRCEYDIEFELEARTAGIS